jgi:hypothetical protein
VAIEYGSATCPVYCRGIKSASQVIRTRPSVNDKASELKMKRHDLNSMSVDELWSLHQMVGLARKIFAEKTRVSKV